MGSIVMETRTEGPPEGGWARLAPALIASDLATSLSFWRDVLGFATAYERPEDEFVYLVLGTAHVMLYHRCDSYETGVLESPLGRGAMFQIQVENLDRVVDALALRRWPLYESETEAWFRAGEIERGLRRLFVQDPDGYLLMIYEEIGLRPSSRAF